MTVKIAN